MKTDNGPLTTTALMKAATEAGVGVLSSCAEGTCGTCETGVLSGLADHRDSVLTEEERAVGCAGHGAADDAVARRTFENTLRHTIARPKTSVAPRAGV